MPDSAIHLRLEPAIITHAAVLAATLIAAFFAHVTKQQEAAIATAGQAVAAIITAAMARPVSVPVITGAAATCAIAAGAFGLHLTTAQIAVGVSVLTTILGLVIRQHVTPVARAAGPEAAPGHARYRRD